MTFMNADAPSICIGYVCTCHINILSGIECAFLMCIHIMVVMGCIRACLQVFLDF